MWPYIALVSAIALMTFFDKKRGNNFIFFFLVFWMLVFSAFRVGGTGTGDYENYLNLYNNINSWEQVVNPDVHAEFGFRILALLGNLWNFPEQFIILSMAVLSIVPIIYVVYKYSPYKVLSLLIWMPYFFTMNMHSSRISVAAAFGLLFLISFARRNISISYFIIAVLFHYSAFALISVFLTRIKLGLFLLLLIFSFIVFIFIPPFEFIIKFLDLISAQRLSSFVQIYLESEEYGYKMALYDPRILLGILISILVLNIKNSFINETEYVFCKIFLVGVLIMMVFSEVTIMAWRVSYYFLLVGIILIPIISERYNIKFRKYIGSNRLMSFIFALVYLLYVTPIVINAEPYEFIIK